MRHADGFQTGHVHAVYDVPQKLRGFFHHRSQHGFGGFFVRRLGRGPEAHLAGLGIGGKGGILHPGDVIPHQLLHGAFPQAEGHDVMGDDHLAGKPPQIGKRPVFEHRPHLKGRAGQHQHMDAIGFKGAAGGCSHRVCENRAVLRELRLLAVVFRHGQVDVPGKVVPDRLQHILPQHQRLAKGLADGLLGEIVVGRPQAAGGEDDIRPFPGNLQRLTQPLRVVAHHSVPEHVDAYAAESLRDLLRVGVDNVAEKQLRAYGNDLSGMGHTRPLLSNENQGFTRTQVSPSSALATSPSMSSTDSAFTTSSSTGRVAGWRGVNTVQQSS